MTALRAPSRCLLTATSPATVTDERRLAIYRGDTWSDSWVVYMDDGVTPLDLTYSTGEQNWTIRATLRDRLVAKGGQILATATCTMSDGPNGEVTIEFPAAQTAAVFVDQGVWDIELENVSDPRFASGDEPYTSSPYYGHFAAYGDVSRSTDLEPVDETGDTSTSTSGIQSVANLLSTGVYTPGEDELGVYRDTVDNVANLRSITGTLGLRARQVGESIRIERRPTLVAYAPKREHLAYPTITLAKRSSAGAAGDGVTPTHLTDNHELSESGRHGFPYIVGGAAIDYYGFPHNRHKRLRSTSLGEDSGVIGYECGHEIYPGDLKRGRRLVWRLRGACENVTYTNAFVDYCVDFNPSVSGGEYDTTNRIRMVSPELGLTWAGEAPWEGEIELLPIGPSSYVCLGHWRIYDPDSNEPLIEWSSRIEVANGFDLMSNDGAPTVPIVVQCRWRVDRDVATRLDTFDGTYQGSAQGTDYLRWHTDLYEFEPVGFNR